MTITHPFPVTQDNSWRSASVRRVLHVTRSLSRNGAGVARVAWDLGKAQRKQGIEVHWACLRDRELTGEITPQRFEADRRLTAVKAYGPRQLLVAPGFASNVKPHVHGADVLHIHGIWSRPLHTAAKLADRSGVPYVVSPHGMLESWALGHRRLRKRIAAMLTEKRFLGRSGCLHALVPGEFADIRRFGVTAPVAVIPNGIELAEFDDAPNPDVIARRWPQLRDRRLVLFLSRLHPKKGLSNLLEAWSRLPRERDEWTLVISGPDEDSHLGQLNKKVRDLNLGQHVVFTGPVYAGEKTELLRACSLFVLPSHSEGFSMAVLEALASRLPVVITQNCNFPEVASAGAGRIIDDDVNSLTSELRDLLGKHETQLKAMGDRGRQLVQRKYTWRRVSRQMQSVYVWMVEGGTPPDCVITD